jgi:predicted nucleic acid-binding protein
VIVVDVNAIAYLWIPGAQTAQAEKVLQRDPEWLVPSLWKAEFRNILCGFLRRGTVTMDAALRCLSGAEDQMRSGEFTVPSAAVMREVARSRCTAYDCEYVALAVDLGLPLVTGDRQILSEFPGRAISLADFAAG